MRFGLALLAVLSLCAFAADKKKTPDVQVLDFKVQRDDTFLIVDGHVKVVSAKPIEDLVITLEFRSVTGRVIGTKKVRVDEPVLQPGEEATIHAESDFPTNAVDYKLAAWALGGDRALNISDEGPHPIKFD